MNVDIVTFRLKHLLWNKASIMKEAALVSLNGVESPPLHLPLVLPHRTAQRWTGRKQKTQLQPQAIRQGVGSHTFTFASIICIKWSFIREHFNLFSRSSSRVDRIARYSDLGDESDIDCLFSLELRRWLPGFTFQISPPASRRLSCDKRVFFPRSREMFLILRSCDGCFDLKM